MLDSILKVAGSPEAISSIGMLVSKFTGANLLKSAQGDKANDRKILLGTLWSCLGLFFGLFGFVLLFWKAFRGY